MYNAGRCLLSDRLLIRNMSQQELADQLLVTKQQIHSYTTGKRKMDLVTAKNISVILDCDIESLYEWVQVDPGSKRR